MVSTAYREQRRLMVVTEARQAEDGSAHRMVIAANELSRNGDELNLRGVSFKSYRKNPVVLWAHNTYSGIPIAKTLKIGHDDQGRIVADFEFNSDDEFAARVENAWNGGFIRGASIQYMPTKVVEVRNEDGSVERLRVEESELAGVEPGAHSRRPGLGEGSGPRPGSSRRDIPGGVEPEPESEEAEPLPEPVTEEPNPEPVTEEPSPNPEPNPEADPFIDALRERVVALEQEFRELAARDTKPEEEPQETQEAPTPE